MSLAEEIRRIGRTAVESRGGGRIESVKVKVGELAAVEPSLLIYAWEAITAGGPDSGSRLDIEWREARPFCAACGETKPRAAGSWLRVCPDCGAPVRIEGGTDLDVLEVSFAPLGEGG